MAGLIEADGSIAVHNKESKAKRPKFIVVFSYADEPLASITGAGTVYNKKKRRLCFMTRRCYKNY